MQTTSLFGRMVIGIVISLIIVGIILVGLYFTNQFAITKNRSAQKNTTTQNSQQEITTQEEEKQVFQSIEEKIKEQLSGKNGWKNADYSVAISHIDAKFIAGNIVSTNSDIPKGVFLVNNNEGENYSVIFDSATPEPCSLLDSNTIYPQVVADMCDVANN